MIVGPAPALLLGKLAAKLRELLSRKTTAAREAGRRNGGRDRRHLSPDGGQGTLRGHELLIDVRQLHARGRKPLLNRAFTGQHAHEAGFEFDSALLGFLKLHLAAPQLLIKKAERLARLGAVSSQILFDEEIQQLLDDGRSGARILCVRKAAHARFRGDFEEIVLLGGNLDVLAKLGDLRRQIALGSDQQVEIGAAHDLFEVPGRGQRLLHAEEIGLPLGGRDPDLLRQDRLELREYACLRFVAVGHQRDGEPANQAQPPGDAECEPPARPHLVESYSKLFVKSVHRRCCPCLEVPD